MPDIAMCANKDCPTSKKCYRYLAIPNEFSQVYAEFEPEPGRGRCIYYINYTPNEKADTKRQT